VDYVECVHENHRMVFPAWYIYNRESVRATICKPPVPPPPPPSFTVEGILYFTGPEILVVATSAIGIVYDNQPFLRIMPLFFVPSKNKRWLFNFRKNSAERNCITII
jgi:hypothetical protein